MRRYFVQQGLHAMSQAYRGPILLTIAGGLLAVAVVAYLIGDLESNARRQEAEIIDQEIVRDYQAWWIEIHAELAHQRAMITDSRRRLDDLSSRMGTMHKEVEKLMSCRLRPGPLDQSAAARWPVDRGN